MLLGSNTNVGRDTQEGPQKGVDFIIGHNLQNVHFNWGVFEVSSHLISISRQFLDLMSFEKG